MSYLDAVADGNDIVNSKPAPDIFVFAAGMVNSPTPECIVIEDAEAGVEAAKKGGMMAIGIGPEERFQGKADKVLPNFANITLKNLLD